jgi:hypothetical protein
MSSCCINTCTEGAASRSLAASERSRRALTRSVTAHSAASARLHLHSVTVRAEGTQAHSRTALFSRCSVPKLLSCPSILTSASCLLGLQNQPRHPGSGRRACAASTSTASVKGAQAAAAQTSGTGSSVHPGSVKRSRAQMIRDTIVPNEVEASLFETLLAAAKHAGGRCGARRRADL